MSYHQQMMNMRAQGDDVRYAASKIAAGVDAALARVGLSTVEDAVAEVERLRIELDGAHITASHFEAQYNALAKASVSP